MLIYMHLYAHVCLHTHVHTCTHTSVPLLLRQEHRPGDTLTRKLSEGTLCAGGGLIYFQLCVCT